MAGECSANFGLKGVGTMLRSIAAEHGPSGVWIDTRLTDLVATGSVDEAVVPVDGRTFAAVPPVVGVLL